MFTHFSGVAFIGKKNVPFNPLHISIFRFDLNEKSIK